MRPLNVISAFQRRTDRSYETPTVPLVFRLSGCTNLVEAFVRFAIQAEKQEEAESHPGLSLLQLLKIAKCLYVIVYVVCM